MKLLLDENLPKKLKSHITIIQSYTVREMGWSGVKNGDLIRLMLDNEFRYLLTFDRNLSHQQNFKKYPICVIVLRAIDNEYSTLHQLMPAVEKLIAEPYTPGPVEVP